MGKATTHHTEKSQWMRTDSGDLGRALTCVCGFVAAGFSWKDVELEVSKHGRCKLVIKLGYRERKDSGASL